MLKKTGNLLYNLVTIVTALCLTGMAILVFINVILRYVFNSGITWSSEMSQFLFVWLVFLGAILAYKDNSHLGVDVFVKMLPKKVRLVVYLISEAIVLGIIWFIFKGSLEMFKVTIHTLAPATKLPMGYVYGIGLPLSISIGIMLLYKIVRTLIDVSKGRDERFNNVGIKEEEHPYSETMKSS